jgi:uncharacterized protein involved in response to NO
MQVSGDVEWAALWQKGFRPFFLLGAVVALVWVGLWVGSLVGWWQIGAGLGALTWHSHEMVFGFVASILAGFFLTAVENWTRKTTVTSRGLLGLVLLWALGRAVVLAAHWLPMWLVALVDMAFLPCLAFVIWRPLWAAASWRNIGFVPVLLAMSVANGLMYAEACGWVKGWTSRAMVFAMYMVLVIVAVVGGRIIPLFTGNALKKQDISVPRWVWVGRAAVALIAVTGVASFVRGPRWLIGGAAIGAGVLLAVRLSVWKGLDVLRDSLLLVLHVGYGSLAVGMVWMGAETIRAGSHTTAALHLLGLGAIGLLCVGMMSRVALGHTGRKLEAHPIMTIAFVLVLLAALARILPAVWMPQLYMTGLLLAGLLWCLAFALYLLVYVPVLTQPRTDGRPG